MANEFVHKSQGGELSQAEYEDVGGHIFNSQATGDIMYASSASQLSRLGIGAANTVLTVTGGIPAWTASPTLTAIAASSDDSGAIGASGTAFSDLFLASGAVINFSTGDVTLTHASGLLTLAGGNFDFGANKVFINDTANAGMTVGLTINQGANDDQALAFKSSDVAHGATGEAETDTWGEIRKAEATSGGMYLRGLKDADGSSGLAMRIDGVLSENVSTTKTTAGRAIIEMLGAQSSGTALADVVTTGNVWSVAARRSGSYDTVFIIDEDGNYWFDGAAQAAFDMYDDLALVRAVDLASGNGVIQSEWDAHVKANEGDLVALNILGAPVADGGLVNGAALLKLHNGALGQVGNLIRSLESRLSLAESKLLALPQEV